MYFYGLGLVLEVIVLAVILRAAWTWPRISTAPADHAVTADVRHRVQV
jgi:hypothetical protein